MKTTTLPSVRVAGELRAAVESVLCEGETLSAFLLESVRLNVERREPRREFITRGLRARDEARASCQAAWQGSRRRSGPGQPPPSAPSAPARSAGR